MPKLKPDHIYNTPEEDAIITAAAMSDPDAMPYTDEEWEQVKPFLRIGRPPAAVDGGGERSGGAAFACALERAGTCV